MWMRIAGFEVIFEESSRPSLNLVVDPIERYLPTGGILPLL